MSAAIADVVAARVPERSWRSEVRAVRVVWRRDLIRFADDRMRIVTALIQPLLFLFVLGPGLQTLSAASTDGVDLTTFMFPGVICMAMVFSAMFNAASLVWTASSGSCGRCWSRRSGGRRSSSASASAARRSRRARA